MNFFPPKEEMDTNLLLIEFTDKLYNFSFLSSKCVMLKLLYLFSLLSLSFFCPVVFIL